MRVKLNTYDELARYLEMFREKELQLLVICSPAGQGKTNLVRFTLPDSIELSGRVTAAKLYDLLFEHKDKLIFLDDIDDIYRDKQAVVLLKMLCQTERVKTLTWQTRTRPVMRVSPDSFDTSSRVILLVNKWETLSDHISAVEDRGIVVDFSPSPLAVHNYIKTLSVFAEIDTGIYQTIGSYLPFIPVPSIRTYINCTLMKSAGLDWLSAFFQSIGMDSESSLVWQLMNTEPNIKERKRVFTEKTGKTSRTYYRIEKRLKERNINP